MVDVDHHSCDVTTRRFACHERRSSLGFAVRHRAGNRAGDVVLGLSYLRMSRASYEPQAFYSWRYRGSAAGRAAALAHARFSTRRDHAPGWLAGCC